MKELSKEDEKEINSKINDLVEAELVKKGFTEDDAKSALSNKADSTCCPYGSGGTCVVGV
jgi:hypothetical protein